MMVHSEERKKREIEKKINIQKDPPRKYVSFFTLFFSPPTADQKSEIEAKKRYLKMEREGERGNKKKFILIVSQQRYIEEAVARRYLTPRGRAW